MKHTQSIYSKYPDLLRVGDDPALTRLVGELDLLCRHQSPPPELVNLSIAHILQAREAESYAVPLPRPKVLRNIARPARTRLGLPRRRRLFLAFFLLGMVLLGLFGLLRSDPYKNYSATYESWVYCRSKPTVVQNERTIASGCFVLYIPQVRVDNDRVTIGYVVGGRNNLGYEPYNHAYAPFDAHLFDEQGRELKRLGGIPNDQVDFHNADDSYEQIGQAKTHYNMALDERGGEEWFDSSSLSGLAVGSRLKLRLEIGGFSLQPANTYSEHYKPEYRSGDGSPASIQGPFSFDLRTTYQNSTQIMAFNQSDTAQSQTVTFEKVVRRGDMTRFYLRGLNSRIDYELNSNGLYLKNDYNDDLGSLQQIFASLDGLTVIQIKNSLLGQTGEWSLLVRLASDSANRNMYRPPSQLQLLPGGPWFFRFKLPGFGLNTSPTSPASPLVPMTPPGTVDPPPPFLVTPARPGR